MAHLAGSVVLRHPGTFELVRLRAGDEVPGWAEALITNPALLAGDTPAAEEPELSDAPDPMEVAGEPANGVHIHFEADPEPSAEEDVIDILEPPMSGPGSGLKAWLAFAAKLDVEVPDGATRDRVIDLVRATY